MSSSDAFYRLVIRFTNGETIKFLLREPLDTSRLSDRTRFALVRTQEAGSDRPPQVFLASLADVSYLKSERIESKELRQRVAGITPGLVPDAEGGPNAVSSVEFL